MSHHHEVRMVQPDRYGSRSLIFGILSLVFPFLGIGILFGCLGIRNSRKQARLSASGLATAGLITSIVGICLSAFSLAITIFAVVGLLFLRRLG